MVRGERERERVCALVRREEMKRGVREQGKE